MENKIKQAIEKLKELNEYQEDNWTDTETIHVKADEQLCVILKELGYNEAVDLFESLDKWYA